MVDKTEKFTATQADPQGTFHLKLRKLGGTGSNS
jgi:hypothetical protein